MCVAFWFSHFACPVWFVTGSSYDVQISFPKHTAIVNTTSVTPAVPESAAHAEDVFEMFWLFLKCSCFDLGLIAAVDKSSFLVFQLQLD